MSIFKSGGQFARNTVRKYLTGAGVKRNSNTQKAGKPNGWPIYNWKDIVNEIGIENFLNDIYGKDGSDIDNNLKKYNTYNNNFFDLRTTLYGNEGFKEGSPFK